MAYGKIIIAIPIDIAGRGGGAAQACPAWVKGNIKAVAGAQPPGPSVININVAVTRTIVDIVVIRVFFHPAHKDIAIPVAVDVAGAAGRGTKAPPVHGYLPVRADRGRVDGQRVDRPGGLDHDAQAAGGGGGSAIVQLQVAGQYLPGGVDGQQVLVAQHDRLWSILARGQEVDVAICVQSRLQVALYGQLQHQRLAAGGRAVRCGRDGKALLQALFQVAIPFGELRARQLQPVLDLHRPAGGIQRLQAAGIPPALQAQPPAPGGFSFAGASLSLRPGLRVCGQVGGQAQSCRIEIQLEILLWVGAGVVARAARVG